MTRTGLVKTSPRWIVRLSGLVLLGSSAMISGAEQVPLPLFNAEYSLIRNGITLGVSTRTLSAAPNNTYIYASTTQATGLIAWFVKDHIDEHSIWRFDGSHLLPLEYVYDRHGGRKTRQAKLIFNWQHQTVTNTIDGESWHMEIPANAQDKLVYQLSIMYDLLNGKKDLDYKIADGGTLKDYAFAIQGEEMLNTDLGRMKTIRIQRIGDKRDTTVWCAPQLSYLPVRLEQQDVDGSELVMQIISEKGMDHRKE